MRSELNKDVPLARAGEFQPLRLGPLRVDPPVVLAPMAGVTNAAFRQLCRQFSAQRCLYVSEMITARSFAMGHKKTLRLASFAAGEEPRSIQLYGTHPASLEAAARILVDDWGVQHIDLNFGCSARKITAQGGGSAIPAKPRRMARLVRAVVAAAGQVPVTVKFRKGIDESLLTYGDAGLVAQEEGCAAAILHARTAAQLYAGDADWEAIADLKSQLAIPVLGNGDIFEAYDALRMMRQTRCDGIVVGRGCLGRPWLFAELVAVFEGREPDPPPSLREVLQIARRHALLLIQLMGEGLAMRELRKSLSWYTKSFYGMARQRPRLMQVSSLAELDTALADIPGDLPFPAAGLRARRAKGSGTQKVSLPPGFLDDRDDDQPITDDPLADDPALSGG